jgi:hypothetical protein
MLGELLGLELMGLKFGLDLCVSLSLLPLRLLLLGFDEVRDGRQRIS